VDEAAWLGHLAAWLGHLVAWLGRLVAWLGHLVAWLGHLVAWLGHLVAWLGRLAAWLGRHRRSRDRKLHVLRCRRRSLVQPRGRSRRAVRLAPTCSDLEACRGQASTL